MKVNSQSVFTFLEVLDEDDQEKDGVEQIIVKLSERKAYLIAKDILNKSSAL